MAHKAHGDTPLVRGNTYQADSQTGGECHSTVSSQALDVERAFERYFDRIYRFLYSRVGNREDAEDLTSQVFLKACQHLDSQSAEVSVASWLFTVARTVLADHWRRFYRDTAPGELDEALLATLAHDGSTTDSSPETEQLAGAILETLPSRYRRVLEMRFLQGYSVHEAARELGVGVGNLRVLQHRALAKAAAGHWPSRERIGDPGRLPAAQTEDPDRTTKSSK
jgi:RNA polymerase sigma-70 factor (ECF subfamily)